uniref:Ribosomal protein L21 n=1 Tax=Romanomermis culicivorax TaxID=13658 RepID=A0A915INT6_ROMCU
MFSMFAEDFSSTISGDALFVEGVFGGNMLVKFGSTIIAYGESKLKTSTRKQNRKRITKHWRNKNIPMEAGSRQLCRDIILREQYR